MNQRTMQRARPIAVVAEDWQGQIAMAAYYRWLARGQVDGYDQQDWYEAETEITGKGKQERPRP